MVTCIDVETTKFPYALPWQKEAYLVSVHAATTEGNLHSWVFNHTDTSKTKPHRESLCEIQALIDSSDRIVGHNFKFDYNWLRKLGLTISCSVFCTQVAEYILRNFQKQDGLKLSTLCEQYKVPTKIDLVGQYWDSGYQTDEIPLEILLPYGEQDCASTLAVYSKQVPQLSKRGQQMLASLEMSSLVEFSDAEYNGMTVDLELLTSYSVQYTQKVIDIDAQLQAIVGDDVNLDSGDQLSVALYGGTCMVVGVEETKRVLKDGTVRRGTRKVKVPRYSEGLGIPPPAGSETKKPGIYSTNAEIVGKLKAKTPEGKLFLQLWKERAKVNTLNNMFFTGLLKRVQSDDMIHPSLMQTITRTSRLSSRNPNGQNFPRGSTGPVKKVFITRY